MSLATVVTKSVSQNGIPSVNITNTITGAQTPPLDVTVPVATPLTVNDGIGVLYYAALQMLYITPDSLDVDVKFYAATAAGGALINTIHVHAGEAYVWDSNSGGTNPLGTTNALSMTVTATAFVKGNASGGTPTGTDVHIRTSLSA